MTKITQHRMIRVGIVFATMLVGGVIAASVAPMVSAQADTLGEAPRLDVDFGPQAKATKPIPVAAQSAPVAAPAIVNDDDPMTLKRVLVVDTPFRHGDYVWDDAGVPQGEVIITVDIKAQTIAVFRAGYQIGAAVVLYGADDYPTPVGTFPITQKDADHRSNVYNNAPMPYMLRLTNDGVAIHASEVSWGNATHGCIGVPLAFAKLLFAQAKLGTKVIVTSGKMMTVPHSAQMSPASQRN